MEAIALAWTAVVVIIIALVVSRVFFGRQQPRTTSHGEQPGNNSRRRYKGREVRREVFPGVMGIETERGYELLPVKRSQVKASTEPPPGWENWTPQEYSEWRQSVGDKPSRFHMWNEAGLFGNEP